MLIFVCAAVYMSACVCNRKVHLKGPYSCLWLKTQRGWFTVWHIIYCGFTTTTPITKDTAIEALSISPLQMPHSHFPIYGSIAGDEISSQMYFFAVSLSKHISVGNIMSLGKKNPLHFSGVTCCTNGKCSKRRNVPPVSYTQVFGAIWLSIFKA